MAQTGGTQGKAAYQIVQTKQFRKDLRRLHRSGSCDLRKLHTVLTILADGKDIPPQCRNHSLKGDLAGLEECHIAPDWLLVYQRRKDLFILLLLRTGTHTDLFED